MTGMFGTCRVAPSFGRIPRVTPARSMPIRVVVLGESSAALSAQLAALPSALDLQVVGAHLDVASSAHALRSSAVDVAIVSSELRDGSGFALIQAIPSVERPSAVVFVSSREEDAVRAFELHATDFIPVPVHEPRFLDAMIRARQQVLQVALLRTADELQRLIGETVAIESWSDSVRNDSASRVARSGSFADSILNASSGARGALAGAGAESRGGHAWAAGSTAFGDVDQPRTWRVPRGSAGDMAAPRPSREVDDAVLDLTTVAEPGASPSGLGDGRPVRVLVREGRRTRFVPLGEVDWFEADGNYIIVHAGAQAYRTRGTITAIETVLDPRQFVRIHRRMVVNMDRVREMSPLPGGDGLLMLGDGSTLRLSRTYRSRVC